MEIDFSYGNTGLKITIADTFKTTVFRAGENPSLEDPVNFILAKLDHPMNSQPLHQLLDKKLKNNQDGEIIILIDDHTRPISSKLFLDALSKVFLSKNIEDEWVKILVSTGLHRNPSPIELKRMLGDEHIDRFDIIYHNAHNELELDLVGSTPSGNKIYLNSHYVQANFRIVTGYVEPHFFSGYSGGRKAVVPGIAGRSTILYNHSAANIDSPFARFGVLEKNKLHEEMIEATRLLKPEFCINGVVNRNHDLTHVAAGNIFAVHNHLVHIQQNDCFRQIPHKYDIVICGNGGYPSDLNLYQSVKSMAIGELACKIGGVIITANECRDGVGQDSFNSLINSGKSPKAIYENALKGEIKIPDVWQIQVMARILMRHSVYVVSSMKESDLGNTGLKYAQTVEDALEYGLRELGKKASDISVLVLPDGHLVLPRNS